MQQLDALRQFLADLLALGFRHRDGQFIGLLDEIHAARALRARLPRPSWRRTLPRRRFRALRGFKFRQQLIRLERRVARINHEIILVINHAFQMARGHVQRQTDARGHALEEPDVLHVGTASSMWPMRSRRTRDERHFDAATVADDAAMLDAFILAAGTFPVLDGTENAFAEKAALFRLERAVVDRLWILDFALAPRADGFGRRERDADVVNLVDFFEAEQLTGVFF